jgi:hypothetical protein
VSDKGVYALKQVTGLDTYQYYYGSAVNHYNRLTGHIYRFKVKSTANAMYAENSGSFLPCRNQPCWPAGWSVSHRRPATQGVARSQPSRRPLRELGWEACWAWVATGPEVPATRSGASFYDSKLLFRLCSNPSILQPECRRKKNFSLFNFVRTPNLRTSRVLRAWKPSAAFY